MMSSAQGFFVIPKPENIGGMDGYGWIRGVL